MIFTMRNVILISFFTIFHYFRHPRGQTGGNWGKWANIGHYLTNNATNLQILSDIIFNTRNVTLITLLRYYITFQAPRNMGQIGWKWDNIAHLQHKLCFFTSTLLHYFRHHIGHKTLSSKWVSSSSAIIPTVPGQSSDRSVRSARVFFQSALYF